MKRRCHRHRHFAVCLPPLLLALLAFSFAAAAHAAAPLPEYRSRISSARQTLDVLLYLEEDDFNQAENLKFRSDALKKIRASLPPGETVEWQGATVEVDNGWILAKLEAYENERNLTKGAAIVQEISERLGAIEVKLRELEQSAASDNSRSKDEDKQKLAEILRRAEYQKPEKKEENILRRKWREFWEWLRDIFPRPKTGTPNPTGFQSVSFVLQIILYALVFGVIGYLLYRFAPFLAARFGKREKADRGVRVILGEQLAAHETSANLFSDAEKLAREGNLRAAIRKGYIALLCELADQKLIGLAQHKTNRDYLRDLRSLGELHQNMKGLTGIFERHWYGFASTEEKDWEEFRRSYQQAISKH